MSGKAPDPARLEKLWAEAVTCYQKGDAAGALSRVERFPGPQRALPQVRKLEGMAAAETGESDRAIALLEPLFADPAAQSDPALHYAMGMALAERGHYDRARDHQDAALKTDPASPALLFNAAKARRLDDDIPGALDLYDRLLSAKPDFGPGWTNAASVYRDAGRLEEAVAAARRGVELGGGFRARHVLGEALFAAGDWAEGWPLLAARLENDESRFVRPFEKNGVPRWTGEPVDRLLVWTEMAPGEEILGATMIGGVLDRATSVVIECCDRMVPVFARSFPDAEVVERTDPPDEKCLSCDAQVAALDIGAVLGCTDPASLSVPQAVLVPDAGRVAELRARYIGGDAVANRPLVGISWTTRGIHWRKGTRTVPLTDVLTRIGRAAPGATVVSLQYPFDGMADEIARATAETGIEVLVDPGVDQLADMDRFVAQVAAMDAVVSSPNTTAHVAGGVGVPCLRLSAQGRGLYWFWSGSWTRCPWYPNLTMARQKVPGDWSAPVGEIAGWLKAVLAGGG